jgi:hypothetical protein
MAHPERRLIKRLLAHFVVFALLAASLGEADQFALRREMSKSCLRSRTSVNSLHQVFESAPSLDCRLNDKYASNSYQAEANKAKEAVALHSLSDVGVTTPPPSPNVTETDCWTETRLFRRRSEVCFPFAM